jgi:acetyl-CoA carboxylase biotin carboxyl carrier protein
VIGGRLHAPHVAALAATEGTTTELRAPQPGYFVPAIGDGDLVTPDEVIGRLEVLGRSLAVIAGNVRGLASHAGAPRAVAFGDRLATLDLEATLGPAPTAAATAATATAERVFRAPTSGRFYNRAAPGKPAFVNPGDTLAPGATICLLEVMKTFHRVTYAGEPARVRTVLVADGDDVNAGDPLIAFE